MEKEKQKIYKTKWFLWLWLIIFSPVGIILLWTCHNEMKKKSKIILSVVFAIWFAIICIGANGGSSTTPTSTLATQTHLYDKAEIKDVVNGSRTEKIGEYSIIKVSSADVTEESLTDWYFNYVIKNNYNWCMILYTDKNDNTGVYAVSGMVQKDVGFEEDEYNDYMLADSSKGILYTPTNEQTLKELQN